MIRGVVVTILLFVTLGANERVSIDGGEYLVPDSDAFYAKDGFSFVVKDFQIDRYEVSNERYGKKNIEEDELSYPVVGLGYEDALKFCKKEGGTLPTSEQWMAAASFEKGVFFPFATKVYPIFDENDLNVVQERASELEVEGFGAFSDLVEVQEALVGNNDIVGMLGNVWEITLGDERFVTLKGGSFYNVESRELLRNKVQNKVLKSTLKQYEHIGFRCVYQ